MTDAPGGPPVAVLPEGIRPWAAAAVERGGGVLVDPSSAEALVWTATGFEPGFEPGDLSALLKEHEGIRWVQLPWAGVEPYAEAGIFDREHVWTSGKGVYARPCAEHALALGLAGLRHLKEFAAARRWTGQAGTTLMDGRVTVFGAGGIAEELVGLLRPFRCHITVVRNRPSPLEGADRVLDWGRRLEAFEGAQAVFLALALTPETERSFGRAEFEAMGPEAWLVNVARGRHVRTDELVEALGEGRIGGAALDVTDPEPLPDDHPLWSLPNCLITPHTANTYAMAIPLLTERIAENVRRFGSGRPLIGEVDPELGY
jgi:phosphoglycerate dehydrogenase-like enzyme